MTRPLSVMAEIFSRVCEAALIDAGIHQVKEDIQRTEDEMTPIQFPRRVLRAAYREYEEEFKRHYPVPPVPKPRVEIVKEQQREQANQSDAT